MVKVECFVLTNRYCHVLALFGAFVCIGNELDLNQRILWFKRIWRFKKHIEYILNRFDTKKQNFFFKLIFLRHTKHPIFHHSTSLCN